MGGGRGPIPFTSTNLKPPANVGGDEGDSQQTFPSPKLFPHLKNGEAYVKALLERAKGSMLDVVTHVHCQISSIFFSQPAGRPAEREEAMLSSDSEEVDWAREWVVRRGGLGLWVVLRFFDSW